MELLGSVDWGNVMKEMKDRVLDILDFIVIVVVFRLKKNVDG